MNPCFEYSIYDSTILQTCPSVGNLIFKFGSQFSSKVRDTCKVGFASRRNTMSNIWAPKWSVWAQSERVATIYFPLLPSIHDDCSVASCVRHLQNSFSSLWVTGALAWLRLWTSRTRLFGSLLCNLFSSNIDNISFFYNFVYISASLATQIFCLILSWRVLRLLSKPVVSDNIEFVVEGKGLFQYKAQFVIS